MPHYERRWQGGNVDGASIVGKMMARWLDWWRRPRAAAPPPEQPQPEPSRTAAPLVIRRSGSAPVAAAGQGFARQRPVTGADDALPQPSLARSPFTPAQPVQVGTALVGRSAQLERAIAAIELERTHVAIFGERGHGKTSLANVIAGHAEQAGFGVVRHACSAGASFAELTGAVLDKIPARFLRRLPAGEAADLSTHPRDWSVAEVTAVLERIRTGHVLIFIDEFDRLTAQNARRDMAELLKNVSDMALHVSFVLIGVAEALGDLLALHHSIHRNLVAIPMPLLSDADVAQVLSQGCERLGLRLAPEALALLVELAHQSPYAAQQLGLHATAMAGRSSADTVTREHAAAAARLILEETRPVFAPLLEPLPLERPSPDGIIWADLLTEAARAPCDGFGWFAASEVALPPCADDLATLTRPDTGPVLRARQANGRIEFAFARPNLRNHLLLWGASRAGAI
jgi:hypothetical protein